MATSQTHDLTPRKPLRLWPGAAAAVLVLLSLFAVPVIIPDAAIFGMLATVVGGAVILLWWVLLSRAPWTERLGAIALMGAALFMVSRFVDRSIANAGQGMLMPVMGVPVVGVGLVMSLLASRRLSTAGRRAAMAIGIVLASGLLALVRTGGIKGGGGSDLHWRWTQTPEQRLLAQVGVERFDSAPAAPVDSDRNGSATRPSAPAGAETPGSSSPTAVSAPTSAASPDIAKSPETRAPAPVGEEGSGPSGETAFAKTDPEWPGFRGPARDGVVHGVRIETDWSRKPPVAIWRRPIGPGWSSFAVQGAFFYTQEQRGEDETVAAYQVATGEPVWRHRDQARFYESNGGAGPRGTPTLSRGRAFAFGATGILNALDARTGAVLWSRNVAADTGRRIPDWGFASSPLVVDDVVIVAASGTMAAYEITTGKPRWVGPKHGGSYSSPQQSTIDGVPQIVLLNGAGATSVAPADGKLLWEYAWPGNTTIVQPAQMPEGDLLISTTAAMGGNGVRRLAVANGPGGWTVEERWVSSGLKPYFNDLVVHKGHAFGFDGSILSCIDLTDGKRKWKGGRYGNGQMVLLADQDVLLVLSEEGELALVGATPDQYKELARFSALDGKTWNHPVLVGDVLLVRNGEEMKAFRLSLAAR